MDDLLEVFGEACEQDQNMFKSLVLVYGNSHCSWEQTKQIVVIMERATYEGFWPVEGLRLVEWSVTMWSIIVWEPSKSQQSGMLQMSSLKNFTVKPTWLGIIMEWVTFWEVSLEACEWGQNTLKVSYWFMRTVIAPEKGRNKLSRSQKGLSTEDFD